MKILSTEPSDWKDLQDKVAIVLSGAGYKSAIEEDIQTVRGTVNVDVLAINEFEEPNTKLLCECKYWSDPVPKTVIHSFRTVAHDYGANYGFIISKKGFQSGAYDAIANTNIQILNWEEFENRFMSKWLKNRLIISSQNTKDLYNYISAGFLVFCKEEYQKLNPVELAIFNSLNREYFNYSFYAANINCRDIITNEFDYEVFKKVFQQSEKDFDKTFSSYSEYFEYLEEKCREGVKKFDNLFGQPVRYKLN